MKAAIFLALCSLAVGVAGCGGGGGNGTTGSTSTVSKAQYRSELKKVSREAGEAHGAVEAAAPQAKTVAQVQAVLRNFAKAEDKLGTDISNLKVPSDAQSANAELARAQHDDATAIRAILPKLAKFKSAQQAFAYLQTVGNTKGGPEGDDALKQLKRLGYTNGS
jgi:hypothetical protein